MVDIFIWIMVFFAALGLLDKILGGKWGLAPEFDRGLATMGGLTVSMVGFYTIGTALVQNHAAGLAALSEKLPFDPSLPIGCLLASDIGALGIAQQLAVTPEMAVFTGALVAGGLGTTVSYQLPVFLATVKEEEIPELMLGFVFGIAALPMGLLIGGVMLGLPFGALMLNMIPVIVLCLVLVLGFRWFPERTMAVLIVLGRVIRILSYICFAVSAIGVFAPQHCPVDQALVRDVLYVILRMVIVTCGGLVLSQLALKKLSAPIARVGRLLGINNEAVIGLLLSLTQSLAMLPLFPRMDKKGKLLNGAFSVCGAYLMGGQFAYVSSLVLPEQTAAFVVNKVVAGVMGMILAAVYCRRKVSKSTGGQSLPN